MPSSMPDGWKEEVLVLDSIFATVLEECAASPRLGNYVVAYLLVLLFRLDACLPACIRA